MFTLRYKRLTVGFAVVAIISFIFGLCYFSSQGDSATGDEPAHIAAGMVKLQHGDLGFYVEQPPLANALSTMPLILSGYSIDKTGFERKNHWNFGKRFLYGQDRDAKRILFLSRLPTMLMFAALCLFFFFSVLKLTGSAIVALSGLVMLGMEPTMMAHARLATPDILCTALIFFSAMPFCLWLKVRKKYLPVFAGVLTGLALLTKVSALVLLPFFVAVSLIHLTASEEDDAKALPGSLLVAISFAFLTVYATYAVLLRDVYLVHEFGNDGLITRLIAPFYEYLETVGRIGGWAFHDYTQPQFLLGKYSLSGWWYYYPIAFVLKTPVVWTLLYLASACFLVWKFFIRKDKSECMRSCLYANAFILLFMTAAMASSLNIGVRYILPVYPFVILSICLFLSCLRLSKVRNAVMCIVLAVYCITVNLHNFPSYISSFNEFIASSKKDAYLVDSNLDWGQDLKRLSDWVRENKIERLYVDYFGGGDVRYYLGKKAVPVNSNQSFEPGYYAISRHYFRMSEFYDPARLAGAGGPDHSWETLARSAKHVATIGDSIYVFKN